MFRWRVLAAAAGALGALGVVWRLTVPSGAPPAAPPTPSALIRHPGGSAPAGGPIRENTIALMVHKAAAAVVAIRRLGSGEGDSWVSGFLIAPDGYILTSRHLVEGASALEVQVAGYPHPFPARLVGGDWGGDLALLKIAAPRPLPSLPLARPGDLRLGQWDVAIGNPDGLLDSVQVGVISGEGRSLILGRRSLRGMIQTDALAGPGMSGGPLLNLQGQVIGVSTAVSPQAPEIGFATPVGRVRSLLARYLGENLAPRPWLGVWAATVSAATALRYGGPAAAGAMVVYVYPDSPAAAAGLRPGEVVVAVNGRRVRGAGQLLERVDATPAEGRLWLSVRTPGGGSLRLRVRLAPEPPDFGPPPP